MKIRAKYTFIGILCLSCLMEAFSHSEQNPFMQKAPKNVKVDGKLMEWGDTLAQYDSKSKLSYTIASDDSDLYIAAFVRDKQLKHKIMAGGITISVNGQGKKSKTYSVTYPLPNKRAFINRRDEDADDTPHPSLIESTSIKVTGFKEVESDVITTSNTYGFNAALGFDDQHNLMYETAIPLSMLHLKSSKNKPAQLAINIAINGMEKPANGEGSGEKRGGGRGGMEAGGIGGGGGMGGGGMGGGGRRGGGMGGGRGGNRSGSEQGDRSSLSQTTDFWVELSLPTH